ncbi:MAG: hypothetical protein Q4D38_00710 [Planctomycetia bacterium]|nr:hypothetical protein [Planctomycetia bacterium]
MRFDFCIRALILSVLSFGLLCSNYVYSQGTLVVPFGPSRELDPAHAPKNFPYKENYVMLPLTSGTVIQGGGGQRIIVNKPVQLHSRRPTVIPLNNGGLTVSPTPVVPRGFNGGQPSAYGAPCGTTPCAPHSSRVYAAPRTFAPSVSSAPRATQPSTMHSGAPSVPSPAPTTASPYARQMEGTQQPQNPYTTSPLPAPTQVPTDAVPPGYAPTPAPSVVPPSSYTPVPSSDYSETPDTLSHSVVQNSPSPSIDPPVAPPTTETPADSPEASAWLPGEQIVESGGAPPRAAILPEQSRMLPSNGDSYSNEPYPYVVEPNPLETADPSRENEPQDMQYPQDTHDASGSPMIGSKTRRTARVSEAPIENKRGGTSLPTQTEGELLSPDSSQQVQESGAETPGSTEVQRSSPPKSRWEAYRNQDLLEVEIPSSRSSTTRRRQGVSTPPASRTQGLPASQPRRSYPSQLPAPEEAFRGRTSAPGLSI